MTVFHRSAYIYNLISRRFIQTSSAFFDVCYKREPCTESIAVILGVYVSDKDSTEGGGYKLTKSSEKFDEGCNGQLSQMISVAKPTPRLGDVRLFYGLHVNYNIVALVGLGDQCLGYNEKEQIDERKEAIRIAAGTGVRALDPLRVSKVYVESFGHAESAAEGASMASWIYQENKTVEKRRMIKKLELFDSCDFTGWKIGLHKAASQNLARLLQETPANNLNPSTFAQTTIETLSKYAINVNVRMQSWAKLRNLNAFLTVAKGACEPPVFLEILYEGCDPEIQPIVLVGKGTTYNSGGMCLKPCRELRWMRGEMSGAACVVATFRAVAALQLPLNVRGLIPLCMNLPGATAYKPGDVVRAHNGKTILIENTSCEGILMHADALSYTQVYKPKFLLDVGTIAPDMLGAFGDAASGVFCNNDSLYEMMRIASIHTGDRIWRFPLWKAFKNEVANTTTADFTNRVPRKAGGGACKAAAFLQEFVPKNVDWIHIDSYNIFTTTGKPYSYLRKGMSGRPTRNLIEFLAQFSCNSETKKK